MVNTEGAKQPESGRLIHEFLAHSYFIYLAAVILGFAFDLIWRLDFSFPLMQDVGFLFIVAGTLVVFWAQSSAIKGAKVRHDSKEKVCRDHFCVGPYVFTRTPTQYGLFLLTLGLGLLYGSFFMTLFALTAFLMARVIFIPKQEHHLALKYGSPYLEYKEHVKF